METLGQQLKAARMRKKLTASEAAKGTRIKIQHIEAIENDDFRDIAAPAYAKGFIRIYSEFLDLDPAPLVQDYLDRHAPQDRTPLLPENAPASKGARLFDFIRRPRTEPEPEPESMEEPPPPPERKDKKKPQPADELALSFDEERAPPRITVPVDEAPEAVPVRDRLKARLKVPARLKACDWKWPRLKWTRRWAAVYGALVLLFAALLWVVQRSGSTDDPPPSIPVVDVPAPARPAPTGVPSLPDPLPVVDLLPEPYLD